MAVLAQVPVLRTRLFYYWDDSAAAFLPHWYRIGEALRRGEFPVLHPDMWMGGNIAAEAQLGLWNPIVLANAVGVSLSPDLAVAAIAIKTEFLVILAVGIHLLARNYGAGTGPAAAMAIALPFAGYTLYQDASAWAAGLFMYALIPYFWWATRRFAHGDASPLLPFLFGYLVITVGNPFGVIAVAMVLAATAIERWRGRASFGVTAGLATIGMALALCAAVVFLPLRATAAAVSWRGTSLVNDGQMVARLGDLLNLSAPTYLPPVGEWIVPRSFPIAYLAWFVVPLLPWLRWSAVRQFGRARLGLAVVGGGFVLLSLLPSNVWLFRYPIRFVVLAYLALGIAFAVVLTAGLRTDSWRARAAVTAGLIAVQTYLSWAVRPERVGAHLVAALLVGALVAGTLWVARARPPRLAAALALGTTVILAAQLLWFPANVNVYGWKLPHDVAAMRATFAQRYPGNTLQIAGVPPYATRHPHAAWRDLLMGNAFAVAGVRSLNSYTGLGFADFYAATCMDYAGQTCSNAYPVVWGLNTTTGRPLADLFRLETVVVANPHLPGGVKVDAPPPGWRIAERTPFVTVLRREAALPWPDGRLAWADSSLDVLADRARPGPADPGEEIRYRGRGRVILAALAWPGWHATVDGRRVEVRRGPAGLIELDLPDTGGAEKTLRLSFEPPGLRLGLGLLAAGLALGLGYPLLHRRRRRGEPG